MYKNKQFKKSQHLYQETLQTDTFTFRWDRYFPRQCNSRRKSSACHKRVKLIPADKLSVNCNIPHKQSSKNNSRHKAAFVLVKTYTKKHSVDQINQSMQSIENFTTEISSSRSSHLEIAHSVLIKVPICLVHKQKLHLAKFRALSCACITYIVFRQPSAVQHNAKSLFYTLLFLSRRNRNKICIYKGYSNIC